MLRPRGRRMSSIITEWQGSQSGWSGVSKTASDGAREMTGSRACKDFNFGGDRKQLEGSEQNKDIV